MTKVMEKEAQTMALRDIVVGTNIRMVPNKKQDEELVNSIKQHGIIEPVIVRVTDDGVDRVYELVAGFRRVAAAKTLGLKDVPVRVMELDDEQAVKIRLIENIQRSNLTPVEEMYALIDLATRAMNEADRALFYEHFKQGVKPSKKFMERCAEVGAMVNKSAKQVYQTMRLAELPTDILDAINSGKLTAGHGRVLLSISKEAREKVFKEVVRPRMKDTTGEDASFPVKDLLHFLHAKVERSFTKAYWKMDEVIGKLPVCVTCAYNSSNQKDLFDGASDAVCTNPPCFNKKRMQKLSKTKEELEAKSGKLKFGGYVSHQNGWNDKNTLPTEDKGRDLFSYPLDKELKEAVEKRPDAFRFVVVKPGQFNSLKAPTPMLAVLNRDALPKTLAKKLAKAAEKSRENEPTYEKPDPKKSFINNWVNEEMPKHIDECFKGLKAEAILSVLPRIGPNLYGWDKAELSMLGERRVEKKGGTYTAIEALRILLYLAIDNAGMTPETAKAVGFDSKGIEKKLRAEAEKAWPEHEARLKAEAESKTATTTGQATPEDASDEDGEEEDGD